MNVAPQLHRPGRIHAEWLLYREENSLAEIAVVIIHIYRPKNLHQQRALRGCWKRSTQQFSSIISSAANPTDAGTVPISLLRGYHGTAANYISSLIEVDGMVAARLVDSLATLESSLCKLSVGLYFKSDSNRTYEHTYMHKYHHNEIFTLFLSEIRVCSMCMYVFNVSTK